MLRRACVVSLLAASGCANSAPPCACPPAVATPNCAVAPSPSAAAPPASEPVASAGPVESSAPDTPPAVQLPPPPRCDGFVEFAVNGGLPTRVTGGCNGVVFRGTTPTFEGPMVEILGPDDPLFILEACDAHLHFNADGSSPRLPGSLSGLSVEITSRDGGTRRVTKQGQLVVTKFGAVGQAVEGAFRLIMSPRLNEAPDTITGTFHVCRAPDRARRNL